MDLKSIPKEVLEVVKYAAIGGLVATTTLIVNLSNVAFRTVFHERTKTYWWLFAMFTIIPLLLFLYVFSLIFGK